MRCVAADAWAGAARRGGGAVSRRYRYRRHALLSRGERALRRGLRDAARDLLRHTRAPRDPVHDSGWWAMACVACGVVGGLWLALGGGVGGADVVPGVRVALPSLEHSVGSLPFPAVAVCDYTLVSRAAAARYAQYLARRGQSLGYNHTWREVQARLLHFSALVTLARPAVDLEFTEYLREVDAPRGGNVTEIVLLLSRGCDALLVACGWRGRRAPCRSLFAQRPTPLGFCCVFNSQYVDVDRGRPPRVLRSVGPEYGLYVAVRAADAGDSGGSRRAAVGAEVLVFPPAQFPLLEGPARSLPATPARATHVVIAARELRAPLALQSLPERLRGCRYRSESDGFSWCLARCRRSAMQQLCGCVPYTLLPAPYEFVCSLNQLDCLNKYREKLLRYYPGDETAGPARAALREELADSIDCQHCLPDCNEIMYSTTSYINEFYNATGILPNHYSSGSSLRNTSVLRLYYSTEAQRLYELEEDWLWYERVGLLGGMAALAGGSLPLLLQLLHCGTLRAAQRTAHYRLH